MPPGQSNKLTKWSKHHRHVLHQWFSNDNVNKNHLAFLINCSSDSGLAWPDFTCLVGSQMMLMLLVLEPLFEGQGFIAHQGDIGESGFLNTRKKPERTPETLHKFKGKYTNNKFTFSDSGDSFTGVL